MRTFKLNRKTDVSGTSGTGIVAIGLEVDGLVYLTWIVSAKIGVSKKRIQTLTVFESIEDVADLHGHGGATELVLDAEFDLNTMVLIESRKSTLIGDSDLKIAA
jgi:hypothetical protein